MKRLLSGLLLSLCFLELLTFAPDEANRTVIPAVIASPLEGQQMNSVHLVGAKEEKKEWELWAEKAVSTADQTRWTLQDVKTKVEGNQNSYVLTGKQGLVNVPTKDFEIIGNVHTTTSQGYQFWSPRAIYRSESKKLSAIGAIRLISDDSVGRRDKLTLTGQDLEASLTEGWIKVLSKVRTQKEVGEKVSVFIRSESAVLSNKDNTLSFFDNVIIEYQGATVSGPRAHFSFVPGTGKVVSLLVEGGVRLSDNDRWATGKTVEMFFESKEYRLRGSPKVVHNTDELFGDEIIYRKNGKEILVNDVKARFEEAETVQ